MIHASSQQSLIDSLESIVVLNKKDLGTKIFPPVETGLLKGDLVFRQHNGGHTPGPNWPYFLAFAEKYFKKKK